MRRDYASLFNSWLSDLENGKATKPRSGLPMKPLRPASVTSLKNGMAAYWRYLGKRPSIGAIDIRAFKTCIEGVPRQRHATRESIIKAFRSFYWFLVMQGLRDKGSFEDIWSIKAGALAKRGKTISKNKGRYMLMGRGFNKETLSEFIPHEVYRSLLQRNDTYTNGRTEYDRAVTGLLLVLFRSGFKRGEVIKLSLKDCYFDNEQALIKLPESGKSTLLTKLWTKRLHLLLEKRPKSRNKNLFLTDKGNPLDPSRVNKRIRTIGRQLNIANIVITPTTIARGHP